MKKTSYESLSLITVAFTDVHETKLQLLIKLLRLLGNTLLVPPSQKWLCPPRPFLSPLPVSMIIKLNWESIKND